MKHAHNLHLVKSEPPVRDYRNYLASKGIRRAIIERTEKQVGDRELINGGIHEYGEGLSALAEREG